ncbi:MAG: methylenetetrahydrofolate reductase [Rhodobiaceae bacterium]|nr:methylenetetrahydrofolate reductase [Rhodobiaceae bacterium]
MDQLATPGTQTKTKPLLHGDISIELAPEMVSKFAPDPVVLPSESKVFLTHLTGKPLQSQIDAARRLIDMGYTPVVHIGARNFTAESEYVDLIEAHARNGVTHGLFLGGNPLTHNSPFNQALDLLDHHVLRGSGFTHAFISGYPEGHPGIGEDTLIDVRKRKIGVCQDLGMKPEIITQFAFDGARMATWANAVSQMHPGTALRLGLAGVTSFTKLIKFAVICGVGPSIAVLKKNAGSIMNVLSESDPGDVITRLKRDYSGNNPLNVHFFPFGGWEKTLDWVERQRRS